MEPAKNGLLLVTSKVAGSVDKSLRIDTNQAFLKKKCFKNKSMNQIFEVWTANPDLQVGKSMGTQFPVTIPATLVTINTVETTIYIGSFCAQP